MYLSSLQPQKNQPKLPFDAAPDMRAQQKTFHKAVEIALSPLSIVNEIKKGTIQADDVKHFISMYPDVNNLLQKKLTEEVTKQQLSGKVPSRQVRQGLSMFLGANLTSTMLPQNIVAAQSVFAKKQQQQSQGAPAKSNKKGTSTLTKSDDSFLTSTQARAKRQQGMS
jgi:hypothetical protein